MPTTKVYSSLYCDAATLANFNAWGQFISNAFSSFGWTAGTDTGQVSWPVGSVPTSYGTFEIWKSADALSSTCPITVRIDYWNNAKPWVAIEIGTGGTNGTGTLLAPHSGTYSIGAYSNTATIYQTCYASGDTGSFRCLMFATSTNQSSPYLYEPFGFGINRSMSSAGVATDDYVHFLGWMSHSASTSIQQAVPNPSVGGTYAVEYNNINAPLPYTANLMANGVIYVVPFFPIVGAPGNPSDDWLFTKLGYLADDTQVSVTMFGTPHTYVVLNNTAGNPQFVYGISTAILMRYE